MARTATSAAGMAATDVSCLRHRTWLPRPTRDRRSVRSGLVLVSETRTWPERPSLRDVPRGAHRPGETDVAGAAASRSQRRGRGRHGHGAAGQRPSRTRPVPGTGRVCAGRCYAGRARSGPMNALELRDVEVAYERRGSPPVRAVAGATLTVERGQIVGLVGESGCGKSSLARAAVGLVRPAAGSIVFEGREVSPLSRRARPRELARLQMVFQNPYSSLNPRRKIGAQLADALAVLELVPRARRRA